WLRGVLPVSAVGGFPLIAARLAFFILPLLVLLAAGGGYLIARRAFLPIERIIAAADAISEGRDLSARIGLPPRDDEIHRIASSFDNMFRRLEASFEAEKQFASDASHELRTPTAVILAQCEALEKGGRERDEYAQGIAAIKRQVLKMSKLIGALLQITRLEQGTAKASFEHADLSELVSVVCRESRFLWKDAALETEIEGGIYADFDVALISRLTGNLLENAFKYGGGLVRVSLRREPETIRLCVSDNGPGIPRAELEKIWQRFYRLEKSRSGGGLGLGLALVKQIADIHGAKVTAESGADGTVFTLLLPVISRGEGETPLTAY
ncbi:MAG: ATP-binding protein, partial [Cloacibacillus evryensis]